MAGGWEAPEACWEKFWEEDSSTLCQIVSINLNRKTRIKFTVSNGLVDFPNCLHVSVSEGE